jgi:Tfp pilus assembly protein PilN
VSIMTTTGTHTLPSVNLLPPEIEERRQLQRTQAAVAGIVALSVVGVGFLYVQGGSGVTSAKSDLAATQSQQAVLQSKLSSLQYVSQAASQKGAAEATLTEAMASEIQWSHYLADLIVITPTSVWFTTITLTDSVAAGSLASPSQATAVGTISFSGDALSHDNVADWLDSAVKEPGFTDPTFSSSTEQYIGTKKVVTFSSNVQLDADALSKRCAQPGVC